MTFPKGEEFFIEYLYDFSTDGGATGNISLNALPANNGIVEGVVIKEVVVEVETALASDGSAAVTLGNTTDADGYLADFFSLADTAGNVINSGEVAGDLIWDDTNDHNIYYPIDSTANNQDLVLGVSTAALTAGKLRIYLKCSFLG